MPQARTKSVVHGTSPEICGLLVVGLFAKLVMLASVVYMTVTSWDSEYWRKSSSWVIEGTKEKLFESFW